MRRAVSVGAAHSSRHVRGIAIRLGIRTGLIASVFAAMGSFAVVAGGIAPGEVLAPERQSGLHIPLAAVVIREGPQYTIDPASIAYTGVVPHDEFISARATEILERQYEGRLSEITLKAYASIAGWPSDRLDELVVVARCESHNWTFATNGVMRGLMQLHPMWFSYTGVSIENWDDPITNLRVAYSTFQYDLRRGNDAWAQWQCKPDGTVAPAPVVSLPELEDAVEGSALAAEVSDDASAEPAPSPTPAPWDQKPLWPPKP